MLAKKVTALLVSAALARRGFPARVIRQALADVLQNETDDFDAI